MKPARLWAFICPRTVLSLTRIGILTPATTSARRPCPTTTIPTITRCLLPRPDSGKQRVPRPRNPSTDSAALGDSCSGFRGDGTLAVGVAVAGEHAVATLREPAAQLLDEH